MKNPSKSLILLLSCFWFLFFAAPCSQTGNARTDPQIKTWADQEAKSLVTKIRREHPRIYLNPQRISALRKDALKSKAPIFNLIKSRLGPAQAAILYALAETGMGLPKTRAEYGRIAAESLLREIRSNKKADPDSLAGIYDWAFNAFSDEERREFVRFCRERIGGQIKIHDDKMHGYRCSPSPKGIIAALSFYGDGIDDAYAEKLLIQGVSDTLVDNLAIQHSSGSKGGFSDGTAYIYQLGGTFSLFLALGIATDSDFFFDNEVYARLPNQLIQALLPFPMSRGIISNKSVAYAATFNDNWTMLLNEYGSATNNIASKIAIVAAEYRRRGDDKTAGLYMWLLKEAFGGIPYQAENTSSFVLMDWSIQPKSPKDLQLPLSEALGWDEERGKIDVDRFGKKAGIGWVAMRSSWGDPDATFAMFKAEPFYYHGHMHHDSLAFMIAKGEELALARAGNYMCWFEGGQVGSKDPGWPQMGNFFSRTISTSNLLIYDPSEKFNGWTNDGGQRPVPYWDKTWGRTYNGTANGNYRDIGGLIRFERDDGYSYVAADATRAYDSTLVTSGNNSPKVSLVQREFVYLRSPGGKKDFFVILDRVESVKSDLKKFWLLQLRSMPQFDGMMKVAVGDAKGGIHLSYNTSHIDVRQDRASLLGAILLPKEDNRVVRRVGGAITTALKTPLRRNDNGPIDIEVESAEGLPEHPTVIITADEPDPAREVFDKFSFWPKVDHASTKPVGKKVAYFCEGKTRTGKKTGMLLGCIRATKSAPGFDMPVGARVSQEFRHMGIEGTNKETDSERIDYPWGYGLGYNYGDGNQYGLWRVEVSPRKASKTDIFLNVLHPTLEKKDKVSAELIESISGNLYGAFVDNRAVIFSKSSESISKSSYDLKGTGRMWQLLCNLFPGKSYQIKQDGKVLFDRKASSQGTIHFESVINSGKSRFDVLISQ